MGEPSVASVIERHFPHGAKAAMDVLVGNLVEATPTSPGCWTVRPLQKRAIRSSTSSPRGSSYR
jgi:hypothetical protein